MRKDTSIKKIANANWNKMLAAKAKIGKPNGSTATVWASMASKSTLVKTPSNKSRSVEKTFEQCRNEWSDEDITTESLQLAYGTQSGTNTVTRLTKFFKSDDVSVSAMQKLGKYVAIDCEMVGVGPEGVESALARVTIVNYNGTVLMDKFVLPQERVTDYRTHVSGITPELLKNAEPFKQTQKEVADIIKDRIVVGHGVQNDFQALMLDHPRPLIRDTSLYRPFRKLISKGRTPALRKLAAEFLKVEIQGGAHSPVSLHFSIFLTTHRLRMRKLHFWFIKCLGRNGRLTSRRSLC